MTMPWAVFFSYATVGSFMLMVCINLVRLYSGVLFLYCVLSWFLTPQSKLMRFLQALVDPLLAPIRALLDRIFHVRRSMLRMDFSPLVLYFILQLLIRLLYIAMRLL